MAGLNLNSSSSARIVFQFMLNLGMKLLGVVGSRERRLLKSISKLRLSGRGQLLLDLKSLGKKIQIILIIVLKTKKQDIEYCQ